MVGQPEGRRQRWGPSGDRLGLRRAHSRLRWPLRLQVQAARVPLAKSLRHAIDWNLQEAEMGQLSTQQTQEVVFKDYWGSRVGWGHKFILWIGSGQSLNLWGNPVFAAGETVSEGSDQEAQASLLVSKYTVTGVTSLGTQYSVSGAVGWYTRHTDSTFSGWPTHDRVV